MTRDRAGRFLTGLIGKGILASRSPWLHEQEADAQGLRLIYSLFDFTDRGWGDERLGPLLDALQFAGFAGVNITFPFKQTIMPLLSSVSEEAEAIGAVNTVVFADGRSIGYNTDMFGFAEGVRRGLPAAIRGRVLQLGCGGAGAAVAHALLSRLQVGTLVLHDVDEARARQLADQLVGRYGRDRVELADDPARQAAGCDGIVNATPVGMAKYPGIPLSADAIEPRHWVSDVVYVPLETEFLKTARAKGCQTLDGSMMAVHQAAEAFRLMIGHTADSERMQKSFFAFSDAQAGTAA